MYAGQVEYNAGNGWLVTVFSDANEWDYIEYIRTADGRACDYDFIFNCMPQVDAYQPSKEADWSRYRIPGHMKFRCVHCGRRIKPGRPPYICRDCETHAVA